MDKWLRIHASTRFWKWKFLFSSASDRTIEVADTYDYSKYSATICVRMAFKQFEMQHFKLNMGDLDPTINGTLAGSQKEKLDKMKRWYYLEAKDNKRVCADCRSCRVNNKSCSLIRCKKCCVEYCFQERKTCKCKDHQKATKARKEKALEELAEAGILDEVDMVNYLVMYYYERGKLANFLHKLVISYERGFQVPPGS
eukprot:scaffold200609_cov36-Cyclotella_meneghiniana.AAC.1